MKHTQLVPVKVWNGKEFEAFKVEVTVDYAVLAQRVAGKVWRNKSGKTEMAYGAIKVVALKE